MSTHQHRALLIWLFLALPWPVFCQPPTVEEAPDKIVIGNAFYRATVQRASGTLADITLADGTTVLGADRLYTDHGIYPEGNTISSDKETHAAVAVKQEGERVIVGSRGVLRGEGEFSDPQRRLDYLFTYTFDGSPTIHVRFSTTPSFTLQEPNGFFSYLIPAPRYAEWFAKATDGVIFQPASSVSTRTFQSADEPLDFADPWMGVLLPEGTILAWSGFQGAPAPTNVFMHESGQGSTAVFCAWLSGAGVTDLVEGQPWTAEFDLHIWPKAAHDEVEMPGFLR